MQRGRQVCSLLAPNPAQPHSLLRAVGVLCTAILYKLKRGEKRKNEAVTTIPTLDFNVETCKHGKKNFSIWVRRPPSTHGHHAIARVHTSHGTESSAVTGRWGAGQHPPTLAAPLHWYARAYLCRGLGRSSTGAKGASVPSDLHSVHLLSLAVPSSSAVTQFHSAACLHSAKSFPCIMAGCRRAAQNHVGSRDAFRRHADLRE